MALQARDISVFGARLFSPDVFKDERGFFTETYATSKYRALGVTDEFVQDNVSFSAQNVLRGLHGDPENSKLVYVLRGKAWDVLVDLRKDSPTYLTWEAFELSEDNHAQLYIPKGCAHGFLALSDNVVLAYKNSALYDPQREFAYRWDSPALSIPWPTTATPIISAKDQAAPLFIP
ncbi:MAG: dTDP-4-dehydrorhamnose 3,5-epimerase [Candidatus Lustribacter sp.]|jgi:dTDP-4-dehydrorhamnose 3,5-epimerase